MAMRGQNLHIIPLWHCHNFPLITLQNIKSLQREFRISRQINTYVRIFKISILIISIPKPVCAWKRQIYEKKASVSNDKFMFSFQSAIGTTQDAITETTNYIKGGKYIHCPSKKESVKPELKYKIIDTLYFRHIFWNSFQVDKITTEAVSTMTSKSTWMMLI